MLSRYTVTFLDSMRSLNISFIILWKVAGELQRPKNMTSGLYNPNSVMNAAFHSLPYLMQILLYPHCTSSLVNQYECVSFCTMLIMQGIGY
jgi:hypothetical protein